MIEEQKALFLKDPLTDDKMTKLINGQNVVTGTDWLDKMLNHIAGRFIATCINNKQSGIHDMYVAWIGDDNKPKDLRYIGYRYKGYGTANPS